MKVNRRDYCKERFTREELAALLERAGLKPSDVLSKRSRSYRTLGLAERTPEEDELLDLMVEEPTLLRRPLVLGPCGGTVVGFNAGALRELIEE